MACRGPVILRDLRRNCAVRFGKSARLMAVMMYDSCVQQINESKTVAIPSAVPTKMAISLRHMNAVRFPALKQNRRRNVHENADDDGHQFARMFRQQWHVCR